MVKVESPTASGTASEGSSIQQMASREQEISEQTTTVKKQALEQVSTGVDLNLCKCHRVKTCYVTNSNPMVMRAQCI